MSKKVSINGLNVELVNNTEANKADFWVCFPVLEGQDPGYADSKVASCTRCGDFVWYDPRITIKSPKLCFPKCFQEVTEQNQEDDV